MTCPARSRSSLSPLSLSLYLWAASAHALMASNSSRLSHPAGSDHSHWPQRPCGDTALSLRLPVPRRVASACDIRREGRLLGSQLSRQPTGSKVWTWRRPTWPRVSMPRASAVRFSAWSELHRATLDRLLARSDADGWAGPCERPLATASAPSVGREGPWPRAPPAATARRAWRRSGAPVHSSGRFGAVPGLPQTNQRRTGRAASTSSATGIAAPDGPSGVSSEVQAALGCS